MNESRTCNDGGTNLTQPRSRPVRELPMEKRAREIIEFAGIGVPPPLDPNRLTRSQLAEQREEQQQARHKVYFAYSCNRIKIGTSRNHIRRITQEILPYCPQPVSLVKVINGGKIVEARLHAHFAAARWRDEWFDLTPELRAYLCENEASAENLAQAEEDYRDWLLCEIEDQEEINALSVRNCDAIESARAISASRDPAPDLDAWLAGG